MHRRAVRACRRSPCRGLRASGSSRAAVSIWISKLLEDYWVGRKYHHTLSHVAGLRAARGAADGREEGLEARQARHERHHQALVAGIEAMGLSLLPPAGERLWTLNTVRVPAGVDEASVRRTLLTSFNIEVGAGLGPLAGKIWRVGLMGASSTPQTLLQFLAALEDALVAAAAIACRRARESRRPAAALRSAARHRAEPTCVSRSDPEGTTSVASAGIRRLAAVGLRRGRVRLL